MDKQPKRTVWQGTNEYGEIVIEADTIEEFIKKDKERVSQNSGRNVVISSPLPPKPE